MTPSKEKLLVEAFNDCCERLIAGESVTACLERYAAYATELAPLLTSFSQVRTLRTVPPRTAEVAARGRADFMAAAHQIALARPARRSPPLAGVLLWWGSFRADLTGFGRLVPRAVPVGLAIALVLFMLAGTLTTGAVVASASALPGDPLYGVKTATEQARLLLTRDSAQRAALLERIDQERLREVEAISQLHRTVSTLRFAGEIQAMEGSRWIVSNLPIAITSDTQITGIPEVGGRAALTVMAPGDGSLVALYITAAPVDKQMRQAMPAGTPTDTPTTASTASPSATSTTLPSQASPLPTSSFAESPVEIPTDAPISYEVPTSSPAPSATRTPTRIPTRTPTPLRTVTPSSTPAPPRTRVTGQFYGWVTRIEGSRWTVDEVTLDTDSDTQFIGDPGVGDHVEVQYLLRPEGSYLALRIRKLDSGPEPVEFTGTIEAMAGDRWTISGNVVLIRADTEIIGDPQVGDVVEFKGVRQSGGEIWATRIRVLTLPEYEFEGIVESIGGDAWVISGQTVQVNGETQIIGDPGVGSLVQVKVVEQPDGSLLAKVIYAVPEEETPTPTSEPTVAPTDTPAPTATDTEVPPTPTDTAVPATDTPAPTDTAAPATDTPAATDTVVPADTPAATDTVAPAAETLEPSSTPE